MNKIIFPLHSRSLLAVAVLLGASMPVLGQKLKSEAVALYKDKQYCKAVERLEQAIAAGEGMDNYSYYYGAQSACQCGQTEKAIEFYKRGFKIYVDFGAYAFFANDTLNSCFSQTTEWQNTLAEMKLTLDNYERKLKLYLDDLVDDRHKVHSSTLTDAKFLNSLRTRDFNSLLKLIQHFNDYPRPPITGRWVLYNYKVSDTLIMPYLVYVPKNYDHRKATPVYVFLHGAVGRKTLALKNINLLKDEETFFEQPARQNAFIIYPMANRDFNWLYHQKAFESVVGELRELKALYNIDDDRVYLNGHSNGGSGSFWFAVNMPTEFATFAAFNFNPKSYTGNTHFGNLQNEYSFFGVSGTDDFLFNFQQITDLHKELEQQGVHWTNYGIKGNHGLPYTNPSETSFLYGIIAKQKRNPYPHQLQWETDNAENGRVYWLEITKLDTDRPKEPWHKQVGPSSARIESGLTNEFVKNKSGAVIASIADNVVNIKASCVQELTFYVLPQLVDINKPLQIFVNGKLLYDSKVKPDKNVLLDEFIKTKDRSLLVISRIKLQIS